MAFSESNAMYATATTEYKINLKKAINMLLRENLPMSFWANRNCHA